MKQVKILMRGRNSRNFRGLNSETELIGQEVQLTTEDSEVISEVESLKIDASGDVQVSLATGDEFSLESQEVSELLKEGQVSEVEPEAKEFEVTRDVVDGDGIVTPVTTKVEAATEDEAIETVKLVDSRRRRNSRGYRVECNSNARKNSTTRGRNSEVESEDKEFEVTRDVVDEEGIVTPVTTKVEAPTEDEAIETVKTLDARRARNSRSYRIERTSNARKNCTTKQKNSGESPVETPELDEFEVTRDVVDASGVEAPITTTVVAPTEDEAIETVKMVDSRRGRNSRGYRVGTEVNSRSFKVVRKFTVNGVTRRKVASVVAPSVDEAVNAVEEKDKMDNIQAEGYAAVVETIPTDKVTIGSDTEETVFETPVKTKDEVVAEAVAEGETPVQETPAQETEETRESNSFKGVSAYVKRAYGIELK